MSNIIEGTLLFHKVTQGAETGDGKMVSTVFFDYYIAETPYENLYCTIKQPVGGDPFEYEALEVGPISRDVPINHEAFRMNVEKYYRKCMKKAISYRGTVNNARPGGSMIQLQDIQKIYVQVEPLLSMR